MTYASDMSPGSYLGSVVAWRDTITDFGTITRTVSVRLAHSAGMCPDGDVVTVVSPCAELDHDVCLRATVVLNVRRSGDDTYTELEVLPRAFCPTLPPEYS